MDRWPHLYMYTLSVLICLYDLLLFKKIRLRGETVSFLNPDQLPGGGQTEAYSQDSLQS